jgi:DNA-binding CsgD family transcriptional regulator
MANAEAAVTADDLSAILEFLELAWANAGPRAFPTETVEALGALVPCDRIGYAEIDRVNRRVLDYAGNDGADDGDDDLFWSIVGEHPLCQHQLAYADFSARRLSDVVSHARLVRSRVYADWFAPAGVVAELEVGINRSRTRTRNFVLDRTSGDFSERDVAVLQLVAPHLARIHELNTLRGVAGPDDSERLTTREGEVLELVAAGLTNAAIAERLWISPGTVKKHLDNVYAKLGVRNRAAAVAAQPGRAVTGDSRRAGSPSGRAS